MSSQRLQDTPSHRSALSIFHNISRYNDSKLESILAIDGGGGVPRSSSLKFTPLQTFYPIDSVEVYGLFSFASALFCRGLGHLAGKAIRKAFLVVERAMENLDVHFLWNFLDIMYSMVLRGQRELLRIFLGHITALSSTRITDTDNPIPQTFRQLADSPEDERPLLIERAWSCNYNIIGRWLEPWCEVVDHVIGSRGSGGSNNLDDDNSLGGSGSGASNSLIIQGLASHVLDREPLERTVRRETESVLPTRLQTDASATEQQQYQHQQKHHYRQMRIRHYTAIDVIDLLGPAQVTRDDLLREPFSLHRRLRVKAGGLALKGRVSQHMAAGRLDSARAHNDQIRGLARAYAGTSAYSDLKYLQHLCAVEDELRRGGNLEYAEEIDDSILQLTETFLADIPDVRSDCSLMS